MFSFSFSSLFCFDLHNRPTNSYLIIVWNPINSIISKEQLFRKFIPLDTEMENVAASCRTTCFFHMKDIGV